MRFLNLAALLIVVFSFNTVAQTRQKVSLQHVTVFLNGAELLSTSKVNLPAGETEVLFTNIAGNINQQSLSVGVDNGVIVQSAVFQNDYLADEVLSPRTKELKDSIETIEEDRSTANNQLLVVNEQIAILSQNRQVSGTNTGLSVAELQKILDLVKARLGDLLTSKDKLTATIKKTDERLTLLHKQLEEEKRKHFQPGGQLLVRFYSPNAVAAAVNISYVTPNAGWTPSYDIRVDKLNEPVDLFYKANVYQNSGISWDKVKLSLSTGNPNEGAQMPALNTWYLSFYQPATMYSKQAKTLAIAEVSGGYAVEDDYKEPATLGNHVRVDNSGMATTFEIDIPYTIASNGKQHNVAVKKYELPATYSYYVVPKLDKDAFLQASIINWEAMDLLPAPTNVFYEGTYVGQGYIDMRTVTDTMKISLGRDKKVIVKRERNKELRTVKTIGTNVRETFAYTISVRNTRKEPLTITIADQFPVSNDKDIEIEDKEHNDGSVNEQTGEIIWQLYLKPNETKEVKFGYTIKYPKGKNINTY